MSQQQYHTRDRGYEDFQKRVFFLGEIFWVERWSWKSCGGFFTNTSRDFHPGIVCRKNINLPEITMAPGSHSLCQASNTFTPEKALGKDHNPTHFYLQYRRPVSRQTLARHFATISGKDKQRLQQQLQKPANGSQS